MLVAAALGGELGRWLPRLLLTTAVTAASIAAADLTAAAVSPTTLTAATLTALTALTTAALASPASPAATASQARDLGPQLVDEIERALELRDGGGGRRALLRLRLLPQHLVRLVGVRVRVGVRAGGRAGGSGQGQG